MDTADYSNKYAKQYSGENWFETVMVEARRARVLGSIARHPHERILEVGCGLEPIFVNVDPFERFVVVEPCAPFAAKARELASKRAGVDVVEGFLEDAAVTPPDGGFDFIIVSSLLHEVADAPRLLRRVHELCGPSTIAHFNVPNVRSFHRLLALEMGFIQDVFEQSETERQFQRTTRFDADVFKRALADAGFDVLHFETYFVKPFTHRQMERLFDDGILDRSALRALDAMTKYMPELGAEMYAEVRRTRQS